MADTSYPAYQYSVFLNSGKMEQIVVRADSLADLSNAVASVKKEFVTEKASVPVAETAQPEVVTPPQSGEIPDKCPECGSNLYDNRPKKASGTYKANAPDFKCSNTACAKAIWIKK